MITNTLAHWLPSAADNTAVSAWNLADWEAAMWVVYWQNALPWLAQRIRETDAAVPEPVHTHLLQLEADSRERTRLMLDGCLELLTAVNQAGIQAIPFKGAALAPLYYPDPLLRPLADLDILIHEKDVKPVVHIIKQLGYRYYSRSAEDQVYLRGERQDNIWAPDNVHPVELHFTLREEYAGIGYNLAAEMWHQSEQRPYWHDQPALLPKPAMLLHHVCAHATSDWLIQRGRLMQIDDIRRLSQQLTAQEWQNFDTAVPAHGARFVYPALAFTLKYTDIPMPAAILNRLRNHCSPALLKWIDQTTLAEASEANPLDRSGLGFDLARRLALSRADEARFWLRSFFPRRWNLSKRYPRLVATPFWPLCYLLINGDRVWHLAKKRWS
jgi:hypothetical protein